MNHLFAQDLMYPFEHYNDQNGISAPIRKIIQDSYGFIWLASSDGLFRFDGKAFKVFRNKLGDSTSIPNNIINGLCLHPDGKIWIASNGGLCYFTYEDNSFHQINLPEELEQTDRYRIHAVEVDYFGQIWFATKSKVHVLNSDFKIAYFYRLPLEYNYTISRIFPDHDNRLFVGTNTSDLFMVDLCTGQMNSTKIQSDEYQQLNLPATITKIASYKKDTILVTSWYGGMHKVVYSDSFVHSIPVRIESDDKLSKNVLTGSCQLKDSLWWIVSNGSGIIMYDVSREKYLGNIKYNISNPSGLSDNYINDIFRDNNGIVWIATDEGVNKYDRLSHQFFRLKVPLQKTEKSIYRRPSCILEDKNSHTTKYLWIAVPGVGLFHYNRQEHNFDYVPLRGSDHTPINDLRISDMTYDNQDRLILCLSSGIYIYNEKKAVVETFHLPVQKPIENVRKLIQDSKGNFWFIAANDGIYYFNPSANQLIHYTSQTGNPNSIPDNTVFCILEDRDHFIWIGTQNRGLCRLNPVSGEFIHFEHSKKQSRTLPDNNIYDIYEDPDRFLWVATENGLARMGPDRNEFKVFTTSEGLSNNDIFFITPDIEGKLWLGTNNGLSVLNPRNGSIINYSQMDGLASNRMDGAAMCCRDGFLYFGTNSMITGCNPLSILKNQNPPVVLISAIKVHGQEIPISRTGNGLKPIELNYKENNFSPEFVALNFTNSAKNRYAYYLEGYDKYWNYCGSQMTTTYTNLPGGTYTFMVKAANNDGIWSAKNDQITIMVQPPFWNTWWFYAIVGWSFILIGYFYFRMKIQQLLHMQQLRLEIARDLHDEVGSTLSSINMTSSMADHLIKTGKNQNELFQFVQAASRKAMEMMNEIIWSIKPENDKPEMMWSRMRQYASEILEAVGIEVSFDIIEKSNQAVIPLRMRKDLFMIFKEALNNQAKYSKATNSKIVLMLDRSQFIMIIEDNGIGFVADSITNGNGLKNMKERAVELGANFKLESGLGIGTRIELKVNL